MLVKDMNQDDIYEKIINMENTTFLAYLRCFLRILNILNMP
jgi:hypothetical protein